MRLITRFLLPLVVVLNIGMISPAYAGEASENPYIKSFVSRERPNIALQPDPDGPKLFSGKDEVGDYKRMLESGFDMIGYSNFQGLDIPPEKATEHAKNIKADLVLVYAVQKGVVPVTVQIDQARKKAAGGDAEGPREQKLYEYFASYWVKLAPPVIGVHVENNTQDDSTRGLRVIAVVKDSPAARAGIQDEDVLTRIGDVALDTPKALSKAASQYAGQLVDVAYKRGGNEGKVAMTLNKRQ